jgi:hypothetical protein
MLLDTIATALPFAAAWAARRLSWGDAAGRVGIAWGVLFLCAALQVGALASRDLALVRVGGGAYQLLVPLLLTPALLAWIGGPLQRHTAAVTGALTLWAAGALLVLGLSRSLTLVVGTPLHLVLLVLSVLLLGAQGRRASDPLSSEAEPGWVWVGGGHVVYFFTYTVGRPLVELLVPRGLAATVDVHMTMLLVYTAALTAIAWGIWLGRSRRRIVSAQIEGLATPG